MKMVPNAQTNIERMSVFNLLLFGHLEQEVIKIQDLERLMISLYAYQIILTSCSRWICSNSFYRSISLKFVCALGTVFVFMVTYSLAFK